MNEKNAKKTQAESDSKLSYVELVVVGKGSVATGALDLRDGVVNWAVPINGATRDDVLQATKLRQPSSGKIAAIKVTDGVISLANAEDLALFDGHKEEVNRVKAQYLDPLQSYETGNDTTAWYAKVVEVRLQKVIVYDADGSVREERGGYFADKAIAAVFADRAVTPAGEQPVLVTVVATDACYPRDCQASAVLFPDGRLLIDYPFVWVDGGDNAADPQGQIDLSHLVMPDGTETQEGWNEVSVEQLTQAELASVQACKAVPVINPSRDGVTALAKAIAILEQLQAEPGKALDIIRQGNFGHALVRGRRVLSQATR